MKPPHQIFLNKNLIFSSLIKYPCTLKNFAFKILLATCHLCWGFRLLPSCQGVCCASPWGESWHYTYFLDFGPWYLNCLKVNSVEGAVCDFNTTSSCNLSNSPLIETSKWLLYGLLCNVGHTVSHISMI